MIIKQSFILESSFKEFKKVVGEKKDIWMDWESSSDNNHSPLLQGVIFSTTTKDYIQKALWLLEKGFEPNVPTGRSALFMASHDFDPKFELVKSLLEHGADVHYKEITWEHDFGMTPFFIFIKRFNSLTLHKIYAAILFRLFVEKGSVFSYTYKEKFYHICDYISKEERAFFLPLLEEYKHTMDEQTLRPFKAFKLRQLVK